MEKLLLILFCSRWMTFNFVVKVFIIIIVVVIVIKISRGLPGLGGGGGDMSTAGID